MSVLGRLFGKSYAVVSAAQAAERAEAGALLLDVREQHEWQAGHAPQARHIPLGQLPARISEVPHNRPVIAVCRSGRRSAHAAALLKEQGIDAANLRGGMHAWSAAGLPVVARGGRPGHVA